MSATVEQLTRLLEHVKSLPRGNQFHSPEGDTYDQRIWCDRANCGTTACVAGWLMLLERPHLVATDGGLVDHWRSWMAVSAEALGFEPGSRTYSLWLGICYVDDPDMALIRLRSLITVLREEGS